jgi:DNA-binding XRE family transcriptional regulator
MLGNKIKMARRRAGFTQGMLARVLGVDWSYISKIERGSRRPPVWALSSIERALGLEPGTLDEQYSIRKEYARKLYDSRVKKTVVSSRGSRGSGSRDGSKKL